MGEEKKEKVKSGRPALPEDQRRNILVQMKLTKAEFESMEEKRKLTNEPMRVFARKSLLQSQWNIRSATDTATLSQLRKIGVNANQIARHLNSGGAMDADIADEIKAMKAEITSLARFIKGAE